MKKIFKIIIITVFFIVVVCSLFAIVDYSRAKNGKQPIFTFQKKSIYSKKETVATSYYGLGYKIIICNKYCLDNKVLFMPLYLGTYAWFIGPDYITDIKITISKECNNEAKLYYSDLNRNIYIYCLDQVIIEKENESIYLDEYLKTYSNAIEDIIVLFTDNNNDSYDDGGTILYKGEEFNLLKCNTIDGNNDIYIGDKTMGYSNKFCNN